ncbi:MAG: tripartite tricarboxylate transporter substrate binding protein [Beijerinckiaceae bacterium]|nr:tripartite tricarboxylate transporter substrate binding protein [Beijerinckiaceae bacterium]MCZ8299155.1 tripartite tricarboxylate transporter substrate binding protein [Beijerinckiaceae bacterium]
MITRRSLMRRAGAALSLPALAGMPARAEAFPSRPVTLIVPFTPGGTTDILARIASSKLEAALGQTVIVENKPGAGGALGAAAVANAAPDGHTLLLGHIGTLGVNPGLYPRLPYDPLKSFTFLSMISRVHNVLAVPLDLPVQSLAELVAYARQRPGQLNYASGGNGSAAHIATEALADATGLMLQHVPYRGTAPAVQDLLGGRVQLMLTGAPVLLPLVRDGKLRGLAVSGLQRIADAPQMPTIAEAGPLPGFEASQWYGIVAPAGLPAAIAGRLTREIQSAFNAADVAGRLASQGADVWTIGPEPFRAHVEAEITRWKGLIERRGIRL